MKVIIEDHLDELNFFFFFGIGQKFDWMRVGGIDEL